MTELADENRRLHAALEIEVVKNLLYRGTVWKAIKELQCSQTRMDGVRR